MVLEMKVKGLALDPLSNMPMIILRDEEEKRSLPIWVGLFEANAIALELEKISTPRPMTHDLIKNILESLDARVQKIVVNDLRDNTFYAVIHLRLGSADITVDSRPSDAIALALRVGAPIFVEEDVVQKARNVEVAKETEIGTGKGDDQAKIKEWLEAPRARRPRARPRRRPRPPSVPVGIDRSAPGPEPAAPARLHLSHALREVRALRAAAAAAGAEPRGASGLPLR